MKYEDSITQYYINKHECYTGDMALFIKQDNQRSELQNRLAAELQARAKDRAKLADRPDGVEDSQYIKGTKKTTSLAWAWVLLIVVAVVIAIWLMTLSLARR